MYDLIIIGAASAGLSASIYAARKKINLLVLTEKIGGQSLLTDKISNYPGFQEISGFELTQKMQAHTEAYGVKILEGKGYKIAKIEKKDNFFMAQTENGEVFETKSVIISTGKSPRTLGVLGEKEYTGKGVTYCSICDAPLFGGKDTVVVGGGNAGMEAALDLTKYANKIYVLEYDSKIRGDELSQEKLISSGKAEFITDAKPLEIKGSRFVESLAYEDRKTGERKELSAQGIFVNIGQIPNTSFLNGFVELNKYNEIVINHATCDTSVSGIFAAGDVTDIPFKQCVIAAGQGAIAALSAHKYLQGLD